MIHIKSWVDILASKEATLLMMMMPLTIPRIPAKMMMMRRRRMRSKMTINDAHRNLTPYQPNRCKLI